MSDDSVNDSVLLAKQRLAGDVKALVNVQIAALVIAGLSCIFPPDEAVVIAVIGVGVFTGAAHVNFYKLAQAGSPMENFYKLTKTNFLPAWMQIYSRWGTVYLLLCLCMQVGQFLAHVGPLLALIAMILLCLFPFYSIIPQFFIARWLAEEAKNGTMQPVEVT